MCQIKKKILKAQDIFQGIEQWQNVHICYLLLPISRIAQALMASFPREVCDKCVDYYQNLDLLLHEVHQRENCFEFICDKFSIIAFCCGNQCERILRLYTAPCFYFILIGISENQVSWFTFFPVILHQDEFEFREVVNLIKSIFIYWGIT